MTDNTLRRKRPTTDLPDGCLPGPHSHCPHPDCPDCPGICTHLPTTRSGAPLPDLGPLPTTTPLGLPATVDYHHVIALLTNLLPTFDPTRVREVRIRYRDVIVEYWDGRTTQAHVMPITHVQGAPTEGGAPTTPPTGLTNIDGIDTQ